MQNKSLTKTQNYTALTVWHIKWQIIKKDLAEATNFFVFSQGKKQKSNLSPKVQKDATVSLVRIKPLSKTIASVRKKTVCARVCTESLGICRRLGGWMAATVSSKVSCCRPELSSPSSISSIALTTITHLHLHNKIWRVNVEVERGDRKWKKYGARYRSFLREDKKSHTHIGIKDTYRNLKNLFFIILFHKYTHTHI